MPIKKIINPYFFPYVLLDEENIFRKIILFSNEMMDGE